MKPTITTTTFKQVARSACVMLLCAALMWPGMIVFAQSGPAPEQQASAAIPPEQLDSLVAPVALYPDNLLAQVLVASTYPLEVIQLHQWLQKNPDLQKDQAKLVETVKKQPWDPSIQAMAPLPDTVKWLAEDIAWTTDLGNAFLAQQQDVMAAVQRMRQKAQDKGTLKSNEQMKVETQSTSGTQVIVIEQSDPQVIYVPSYDPVYAYGAPAYPYPPVYYPPYGGAVAAGVIGFGIGLAVGAAWGGGGWGWGCGWGGGDININNNNNFNRNTNINGGNRNNVNGGGKWQHNASHRGGAPYGDRGTANKFGGSARGDSLGNRQGQAKRDLGNRGNDLGGNRGGVGDRNGVGNNRGSVGDNRNGVGNNRGGVGDNRNGAGGNRNGISDNSRGGNAGGRTGSDKVGSRDLSNSSRGGDRGMGGGSSGMDRSSTRSSSDRGRSSMNSSSRGGGSSNMSRGGGGGASRGGGGASRGGGGGGGRRR